MAVTIDTKVFKDIVSRAAKAASQDRLLPLTSMMAITLQDNVLTLITTDAANTLKLSLQNVVGDDFYVVVSVELFSKLIAKTTSKNIKLSIKDGNLQVTGNGVHLIPVNMDDGGEIRFPEYVFEKIGEPQTITVPMIKSIIAFNKPAMCEDRSLPFLRGYYLDDYTITTDQQVICFNRIKASNTPYLVSPEMMLLLSLSPGGIINFWYNDGYFLFEVEGMVLYGQEVPNKDYFPIEDITPYLSEPFEYSCKISSTLLTGVLDRLALFIEPYDSNTAIFHFFFGGLQIESKKQSSTEVVEFAESKMDTVQPFRCTVDVPLLRSQLAVIKEEFIEIHFGNNAALKVVSSAGVQIIALVGGDELGNE